jgi:anti-sigma B factor antagonist
MEINVRKRSPAQVVQLRGPVRLGTGVDTFRQTLDEILADGDTRIVLNLEEVSMLDSSGIGVLMKSLASAKQRGGDIRLVNPSKFVSQTLRMVGLLNLFQTYPDEDSAVASYS